MDQQSSLFVSQEFNSLEAAKGAVLAHAIRNGLAIKVTHSDKTRYMAICPLKDSKSCLFAVRITSKGRDEAAQIRKLVHHTCDSTDHPHWKRSNSAKLLA